MRKPMNRLWRLVVLLTLALALPLRAQAGPLDNCCIAGIAQMPAHGPAQAAQASVETGSPHDCVSQFGCAGDRHVSGPHGCMDQRVGRASGVRISLRRSASPRAPAQTVLSVGRSRTARVPHLVPSHQRARLISTFAVSPAARWWV
jgi:hypothetical protein